MIKMRGWRAGRQESGSLGKVSKHKEGRFSFVQNTSKDDILTHLQVQRSWNSVFSLKVRTEESA